MASNRRTTPMEDDIPDTSEINIEPLLIDNDDLSPEQELDQDINNLSLEDSPAGPGIRVTSPEVSTIPDSMPPDIDKYDQASDVHIIETCTSSISSSLNATIGSFHSQEQIPSTQHQEFVKSRLPLRKPFITDKPNQTVARKISRETPFSSATDIVVDKNTGAISKTSVTSNNSTHTPDNPQGCVPITNFFKQAPRPGASRAAPPNICTWRIQPTTSNAEQVCQNSDYVTPNTFNEPLPQRNPNKRARRNTGSNEDTSCLHTANTNKDNTHVPVVNANAPNPNGANNANKQTTHDPNPDRNVTFSLQGDENPGDFFPIPPEGLPFFRRARGCYSAEARANSRAQHLDRLGDNGKPPRWAYGIGPMPSYMTPVAKELVDIKKRHALDFTRAVARSLRESSQASRRQGNLNLDTVQTIYGQDTKGFDRAATKLTTLVNRDNTQENERLSKREELIGRSPTTDTDIADHLSGRKTATRSYAGVVANEPPQPNDNAAREAAPEQRNGRDRPRQRSRSRGRNGGNRANRANSNRRNDSRSPIRDRDNRRNDNRRNRSQERRVAQPGRGQRNGNRRQSHNNYRDRDQAFDYMEKMFNFFSNR